MPSRCTLFHQLAWRFSTAGLIYSSPVVWNHIVYFASTDNNLYAVVDTTGVLKWRCRLGNWVESTPAVAAGILYVRTYSGNLYAYSTETGALLGSYPLPRYIHSSPAIANDYLYFGGSDGNLYAFGKSALEGVASAARLQRNYLLSLNYPNPFNLRTVIK